MVIENLKNKCQYWVEDLQCKHWSSITKLCVYSAEDAPVTGVGSENLPSAYPVCNYIGTNSGCSHFEGVEEGPEFRCVLPVPSRHGLNYKTSRKYAFYTKNPEGVLQLDTSAITGYGGEGTTCVGQGESGGTNKECSGFFPYIMGFGKISPTTAEVVEGQSFSFTLPLHYSLLNVRSLLSTCYWWDGPAHIFHLQDLEESETPVGPFISLTNETKDLKFPKISIPTGCTRGDTSDYTEHTFENYACNGSHSNCGHYTGICWEYAINDAIESGDKVLAEQILELRYYLKEESWTPEAYSEFGFENLVINALVKTLKYIIDDEATYELTEVGLEFGAGELTFTRNRHTVTEGTEVSDSTNSSDPNSVNFPTLVRDIEQFLISPLIVNNFFNYYDKNIFETNKASGSSFLVVGSQYTYAYDSICINVSKLSRKPDFLKYINEYPDVNTLYPHFVDITPGEPDNCASVNKFAKIQADIEAEIADLRINNSECVFSNFLSKDSKGFIFEVDSLYGENELLVLSKYSYSGGTYWGYSTIKVFNTFVTGFLLQKDYTIKEPDSSGGTMFVDRLYDYRRSLFGYECKVEFDFLPFVDKTLNYRPEPSNSYNDFKAPDLLDPAKNYSGNVLYRLRYNLEYIERENLYPLGSSGHILVDFPDSGKAMTAIYGEVKLSASENSDLYLKLPREDGEYDQCPMQVVKYGIEDGLQGNQFILSPKNMDAFRSLCKGSQLYVKELLVPIRFNQDDVPEDLDYATDWTLEPDPSDELTIPLASGSVERSGDRYTITNFRSSLVMAAGVSGASGRAVSLIKTKMAVWIKIPMAPDVEMFYKWAAEYDYYENLPTCTCCGPYTRRLLSTSTRHYSPPCGDHENSPTTGIGKMWWPYVQCSDYSYYLKVNNQTYGGLTAVKGLYKELDGDGGRVHGNWDMRMEGPDENDYKTGLYCCFICPCSCQVTTYNYNRKAGSDAHFAGFSRYRGEVGRGTLLYWLKTGGGLPKFGNTLRPSFRSYRSTDYIQYLYYNWQTFQWETNWMWMPSNMSFSDIDYTNTEDQVYKEFCNTDVLPVSALGTMMMDSLDSQATAEYIGDDRYRFREVFEVYLEDEKLAFPKAMHSNQNNPVLQYKAIGSKPIQWAWREIQKDVDRNVVETSGDTIAAITQKLLFLDLYVTPYEFDMQNMEHRLVCDEGKHTITFTPPPLDESTGEYEDGTYPTLQLDTGLERRFTWQRTLDPSIEEGEEVDYPELTSSPWSEQGLFDSAYSSTIEEAEEVETFLERSSYAGVTKSYYNRGISFDFTGALSSQIVPVVYHTISEFECSSQSVDNILMAGYPLTLEFSFAGIKKAVSKGSIVFKYGIEEVEALNGTVRYAIHCVPAFSITVNEKVVFSSPCKIPTFFGLRSEHMDFDYHIGIDYLSQRGAFFNIDLNLNVPTDASGDKIKPDIEYKKINAVGESYKVPCEYYASVTTSTEGEGSVKEAVSLFDTVITLAKEDILVHERKYKVSFFAGDPEPPHGINVGARVLSGRFDGLEYDTVWQRDKDGSVVNLPESEGDKTYIHKTRSRFVFEAVTDTQSINKDLKSMESTQEELYNKAVKKNVDSFSFTSNIYPDLVDFLEQHNLRNVGFTNSGSFNNSIIYKLGTLVHYPKMQGKGHQLLPSLPWHEGCRHVGGRDGCNGDDTFAYSRVNMDDGSRFTSSFDAANIFYQGTLFMMQRVSIAKFLINRMASTYAASARGKVFFEGEPSTPSIPEFMPMPGLYDTTPEWYGPTRSVNKWPSILPGLWPTLGNIY